MLLASSDANATASHCSIAGITRATCQPSLPGPGRFLPWRCFRGAWHAQVLTAEVVILVDDAGTGRSQSAGGAVPDPRAWDHIPPCGSDDLAVSVRWERSGVGLAGQIMVANVSGRTCRLSHKPWVVPLGTDGRELPIVALTTMEFRIGPVILAPGARAAAPVGWAGWCGDPASGVVRVNWFSGSAVVEVEGPRQPDCPDSRQPTNLWSSWFDALD
jgi:Protein of unknown function (DUF4232)